MSTKGNYEKLQHTDFKGILSSSGGKGIPFHFLVMTVCEKSGKILGISEKLGIRPNTLAVSIAVEKKSPSSKYTLRLLGGFKEALPKNLESSLASSFEKYNAT